MPPTRAAVFRGNRWSGIRGIQNLFIFGDSYSSIDEDDNFVPNPSDTLPLGTAFPGEPWTDDGLPNWVGHLVTDFTPHLRVYDYAKGGETVTGLAHQVQQRFIRGQAKTVSWNAANSLFVLWIGINDLSETSSPVQPIRVLFQLMSDLYDAGARNFLLIDCPPIHRTPAANSDFGPSSERYEAWNSLLFSQARFFVSRYQDYSSSRSPESPTGSYLTHSHSRSSSSSNSGSHSNTTSPSYTPLGPSPMTTPNGTGVHGDLSVFIFSSWDTFMSILDYPEAYDFDEDNVDEAEGPIWMDSLHPTSKVHAILAKHLYKFLSGIH